MPTGLNQERLPAPSFVRELFADPWEAGKEVVTLFILTILPDC